MKTSHLTPPISQYLKTSELVVLPPPSAFPHSSSENEHYYCNESSVLKQSGTGDHLYCLGGLLSTCSLAAAEEVVKAWAELASWNSCRPCSRAAGSVLPSRKPGACSHPRLNQSWSECSRSGIGMRTELAAVNSWGDRPGCSCWAVVICALINNK